MKTHEFYRVNIHEERIAAYVARSMPFIIFVVTVGLLALGVLRSPVLLLTITATLNVSMWLWVVSMAMTCFYGVLRAQETIGSADEDQKGMPEEVKHIIVIPNYKEDKDILDETLLSLKQAEGSKHFTVILAMEAREEQVKSKAEDLEAKFKGAFQEIKASYHPENLQETHIDGSQEPEVRGKASNVKYAVQEVGKAKRSGGEETMHVLTIIDADVILHPKYFAHVSREILQMKERGESPKYTFWQAPQLPWRNFYTCPVVSRVWGYISSLWEFGGVAGLIHGSHHMVFSAYSLPLDLAMDAECWDGDVIAEDHHAFLKAWFYAVYLSEAPDASEAWVQVKPVMLPSKSTSVSSGGTYWSSWSERWDQAKRHAQGVAELCYALLAAWDMLSSLPVNRLGACFLWRLVKVVFKPFMMHIVSTLQAISLLVLTVYWLASGNEIPWCPDHLVVTAVLTKGDTLLCGLAGAWVLAWPVVIPFMLLIATNFIMIRACFILPKGKDKESCWHKADGKVQLESGFLSADAGKQAASLALIAMDVAIFFGPIMAVYGVLVEILAYCNVLLKGNRFEYKTASKSISALQYYGSISEDANSKKTEAV